VSEISEFWQPPKRGSVPPSFVSKPTEQPDDDQIDVVATSQADLSSKKWSIWRAANAGLLVTVLVLAVQIASGRGYELASYAQTASVATLAELTGQILAAPLIFVIITVFVNILKWSRPSSDASANREAIKFGFMLIGIGLSLALYGQWFFSSNELVSGATRDEVIGKIQPVCVRRQMSLRQGATPSDDQISRYCSCVGSQIADKTTYKRLTSDTSAPDVLEYLKQQAEAAGQVCRTWMGL
jgi:hypothetical protein